MFRYKYFLTIINYFCWLYTTCGGRILVSTAMYYFWLSYTTFDSYILLLMAIYHIRRLYITFNSYILLLALGYFDFARIQVFPAICFLYGFNTRFEFSINLLTLIQFNFFCNSIHSRVSFSLPF